MLKKEDIPYPEDYFPHVVHTANISENTIFWRTDGSCFVYDEKLRDAGKYILRSSDWKKHFWNLDYYNFALFKGIEEKHKSIILFELKVFSSTINDTISVDKRSKIRDVRSTFLWKALDTEDDTVWILWSNIYPDAPLVLSLNYQDFPIAYLSFDIKWNQVIVKQIQWSNISDRFRSFSNWSNHILNGFNWRQVLILFLRDYLEWIWFNWKIVIQCSENNPYYKKVPSNIEDEKRNTALQKNYNETAIELWYARDIPSNSGFYDFSKNL